ncbi:MAG TPA: TIGR03790 family protein [Fimbriiglobus sp.]|nr:TIGR03790 family protein [Fimbriiglobus sp.]
MRRLVLATLPVLLAVTSAPALEPADVVVICNKAVPESRAVAEHYLAKRQVPKENLVELDLPTGEDISRADFEAKLAGPLRAALKDRKDRVKALLTVYGVPLRVGAKLPTDAEKAEAEKLKTRIEELRKKQAGGDASSEARAELAKLTSRSDTLTGANSVAAVDSELMLLWWPAYEAANWVFNPLYWQVPEARRKAAPPVLLTARLDGPSAVIAKRLVDDAVEAEAAGLTGKVYVDARGIKYDPKNPRQATGYEGYDESFREAAALLKAGGLDVTLDDAPELFKPGACPDCALYAGWYQLANYVPSFTFAKGAVAWHLASSEAVTLRDPKSKLWCPNLLRDGAAATIGPVDEPFTVGFPKPAEFFGFLATGQYTLAECYAKTVLLVSWRGVLVGDPLYNPFAKSPRVKESDVKPSPKGSAVIK